MRPVRDIVDFHAHILPGADHGSDSVKTSLAQLTLAREASVTRIIATPHFYPDSHSLKKFIHRREEAFWRLSEHLSGDMPKLSLGAEVLICNGIENMPDLDKLFIDGTNVLLLELPFADFQYPYVKSVSNLVLQGVNVVIAHAERYSFENISMMIDAGANIQLNSIALSGWFMNRSIRDLIESGRVVAIGSDIHGKDRKAYRSFAKAASIEAEYIDQIKLSSDSIWETCKNNNIFLKNY